MKTVKIGIFGLGRGSSFYKCIQHNNGEIVAVCEKGSVRLEAAKKQLGDDVAYYTDFDEFLSHPGMEAVLLCNYFHEHASYAIKALEKNIHVLSECTSNGTMAEGVALVRAAEKSKAIYMLAENYPLNRYTLEMRRLYRGGSLGKVLFAEGEYNHPLNPADKRTIKLYRPSAKHWRTHIPRTYYITHALAPLMHITGATPVRVTAMPVYAPFEKEELVGVLVGDRASIITCLNDDDSVFRVTGHAAFGAHETSYRICATKGQVEYGRDSNTLHLRYNGWDIPEGGVMNSYYLPEWNDSDARLIEASGHGGGDFMVIREFFRSIWGEKSPVFDVYFATTMASVGILAHRSQMERGMPYDIPDFRKEEDRKKYENDTISPFWGSDGSEPSIYACSHQTHHITQEEADEYDAMIAEIE